MLLRRKCSFNLIEWHNGFNRTLWLTSTMILLGGSLMYAQSSKPTRSADALGKQIFASTCASCHGLDGNGGEHAPNIVTNPAVERLSEKELTQIVSAGVPAAGMPGFRSLGAKSLKAVTDYLRQLKGKGGSAAMPGDPKRGEMIFFGKGECANCHMAGGRGGFIAPDLSAYGQTRSPEKIKAAITTPSERDASESMVSAVAINGERYNGILRDEDNFSLQLQSTDGSFHLLSKADLKSIERGKSIMPSDYKSKLSDAELNDLVSYLMSLAETAPRAESRRREDDE